MPHAFAFNRVHVIFSTRERRPTIVPAIRDDLHAYVRGIARNYNVDLLAIGGVADHVHLLIDLPPKLALADCVRALKANSSKWMNENGRRFAWQRGYAAFSVSESNLQAVSEYIRAQETHHGKRSFEEELKILFEKHGIKFDPAIHLD